MNPTFQILLALILGCNLIYGSELEQIKVNFQTKIPAPSIIEPCADKLWVYSVEDISLYKLNPKSGAILEVIPLAKIGIDGPITAMGCDKKRLLIASFIEQNSQVSLYTYNIKTERYLLPGKHFIKDIFCGFDYCYLIRNEVSRSQDLTNWSIVPVEKSANISRVIPKEKKHIYSQWQDQFLIGKGIYFRGQVSPDGELLLLGSSIVTATPSKVTKWERWGFNEGDLLFPKGLASTENLPIVISDVGLGMVSIFTKSGEYQQSFGSDTKSKRFGYPIDISGDGNIIYVADFLDNKIYSFNIQNVKAQTNRVKNKIVLKKSWFRHASVQSSFPTTRCLNCHDGLATYNLPRFINNKSRSHHPVGVEMKAKTKLPLGPGNTVVCSSCHNPHHTTGKGEVVSQLGDISTVAHLPFQLRLSLTKLCASCHQKRAEKERNHMYIKNENLDVKAKQVVSCNQCHQMHQSEEKLLKNKVVPLCISCHRKSQIPKGHPIAPDSSKVTCISCHSTHGARKRTHFARHDQLDIDQTCLGCHEDWQKRVGLSKHLVKNIDYDKSAWPDSEVVCLKCHKPHKNRVHIQSLCLSCHKKRKDAHHRKNLFVLYGSANLALPKDFKTENGILSCISCHDPHDLAGQEKSIRTDTGAIRSVCTTLCHKSENFDTIFTDYHKMLKQRKKKNAKSR